MTDGKIEDVQFIGSKAAMATLVWEARGKPEKERYRRDRCFRRFKSAVRTRITTRSRRPNPGCVRMTVILTHRPEGWGIARVQATGLELQSRAAAV
jgi:hypothetical protein